MCTMCSREPRFIVRAEEGHSITSCAKHLARIVRELSRCTVVLIKSA